MVFVEQSLALPASVEHFCAAGLTWTHQFELCFTAGSVGRLGGLGAARN